MNASLNLTTKDNRSKFQKQKNDIAKERVRLNFSVENKDTFGVLTPKTNKNSILRKVSKESFLLSGDNQKKKKSDGLLTNQGQKGVLSCKTVLQKYKSVLNSNEIEELDKNPDIYFIGKISSVTLKLIPETNFR
jgi:hypothetical protein